MDRNTEMGLCHEIKMTDSHIKHFFLEFIQ